MAFLVDTNTYREMVVPNMDYSHNNNNNNKSSVPAPFLIKTYQLVDDPCTDHIVSWGEDDTTFVVWRPPEFSRDILPKYFKHNNFSSFVRQLNTYGFRKIVADRWEFANEYFRKQEKHLLSEIQRRKSSQMIPQHCYFTNLPPQNFYSLQDQEMPGGSCWVDNSSPPPFPHIENDGSGGDDFISALSEDNQRLRRSNSLLVSELTHMKKLYNDIIYFLQNHVTPVTNSSDDYHELQRIGKSNNYIHDQLQYSTASESTGASTVKLFGVPLHGKKRLHHECSESLEEGRIN